MDVFYYTYVLQSEKDGKKYIGYTKNLNLRFEQHQNGKDSPCGIESKILMQSIIPQGKSTKHRRPLKLIYFEACLNQKDALRREKYSPCEIKSEIFMRSIISQGKKRIMEKCF